MVLRGQPTLNLQHHHAGCGWQRDVGIQKAKDRNLAQRNCEIKVAMIKRLAIGIFITCCYSTAFSQSDDVKAGLLKFTTRSDSLTNKYPAEKLFIQFDKPGYIQGDTIWFKAYL